MLYELRVYTAVPENCRSCTPVFAIIPTGSLPSTASSRSYWVNAIGPSIRSYLFAGVARYGTPAEGLGCIQSRPEWVAVKNKSEENGALVQTS